MNERFDTQKNIRSPYDGEVVEVLTERGVVVGTGTPLFKLKNQKDDTKKITSVLYIPSKDGKKIKKGMEALVSPSIVQPQELILYLFKISFSFSLILSLWLYQFLRSSLIFP